MTPKNSHLNITENNHTVRQREQSYSHSSLPPHPVIRKHIPWGRTWVVFTLAGADPSKEKQKNIHLNFHPTKFIYLCKVAST